MELSGSSGPGVVWSTLPAKDQGEAMVVWAKQVEAAQQGRREENLKYAMAWGNRALNSLYDLAAPADSRSIAPWALISAVVGTGESMITRNHVRLTVETSGAKAKLRREAKEASRWLAGVFNANKVNTELAPQLFAWAAVCNLGLAVVRRRKGQLHIDQTIPDEVIVADSESLGGDPHQGAIGRWYAKAVALRLFGSTPEKAEAIETAEDDCPAFRGSYRPPMVRIYEGWSKHGSHITACNNVTLEHEEWDEDFLPWIPMYVERPKTGYWGRGWAQMLFGYQCQLWELNDSIEEQIRLGASPKWLVPAGANVNPRQLSNEHMGIVNYAVGEPKLVAYPAVHRDLLEERVNCWKQGLSDVGMSDWGVSGENPGEISGAAMDALRDREHGRMVTVGQEFESWHTRLGEVLLKMGHLVDDWEVQGTGPGEKELRKVSFKNFAKLLKDQPWTVQPPAPISAFPSSPAGKRQQVERWVEKQVMTPQDAAMALELPDNDAESSLLFTVREHVERVIEDILERGVKAYKPPEPMMVQVGGSMPAQLAYKMYLQAVKNEEDEKHLDIVLQWIAECDTLARAMLPPTPTAGAAPPGGAPPPGAMPMPQPMPTPAASQVMAPAPMGMPGPGGGPMPPSVV